MCNLGMAVELMGVKQGITQGREQGMLECIKALMETMKLTAQQAMDALEISNREMILYKSIRRSFYFPVLSAGIF